MPKSPKKIASAVRTEVIEGEIEKLTEKDRRLLQSKNYEVFLAPAKEMPFTLKEIGRQREVTFRAIGEGTNNSTDIDHFDEYYHHMFLWDNEAKVIAGAYRMGLGSEIFAKYGIDGFYLQDLFRFEPELFGMMSQSIEMGRAYIIKEYQQKPMPLFLLWKGIVHTTLRHPEHKYLIGGVSISNQFSNFSKSLMIEFMKSNYWDPYVAQYIRPKKEFKVKLNDADKEFIFDETQADLNKFDKLIDEVEPGNLRLPVLIKKYIKQNAKVIAFNVDPLFNNSVTDLENYEIKVKGKIIPIREAELLDSQNVVYLHPKMYPDKAEKMLREIEIAARKDKVTNDLFEIKLSNIRDVDGNVINQWTSRDYNQFREFFAQEVKPGLSAPTDTLFMKKQRPIFKDQPMVKPDNFENYWMNTPLQKTN